jgi:hypothetical protein
MISLGFAVCLPPFIFKQLVIFTKFGMNVMPLEVTPTHYFSASNNRQSQHNGDALRCEQH